MKIILVRHGQDTPNKRGGWSNEALTHKGIEQIKKLSDEIKDIDIDYILSSDLTRAVETTAVLRSSLNYKCIKYYSDLREVNNGVLAGMDNDTALIRYPNFYWKNLQWEENYPNGESPKEFYERIKSFWTTYIKKTNPNSTLLVVTHMGVIEIIQSLVHKTEFSNKKLNYYIDEGKFSVINLI